MTTRDTALAVLVAMIWGFNFVAVGWGLEGMPPLFFLGVRFLLVLLPAVLFVPRPAVRWQDLALVGTFMSLCQFSLFYLSIHLGLAIGLAAVVLQTSALLTIVVTAVVLRERPSRIQLVGLLIGAVGLVVVAVGRGGSTTTIGFCVGLGAALSWAIGNTCARRMGPGSGLGVTVWSALVVPVPAFLLSFVLEGPARMVQAAADFWWRPLLSSCFTAFVSSLVAYSVWNWLLSRHAAASVVPFSLLVTPLGMMCTWLVLDQTFNAAELIGAGTLLLGVAVAVVRVRRPRAGVREPEYVPISD